ncbi:hypothetical protein LXL04_001419 [Taraxacum kok-saghyz]
MTAVGVGLNEGGARGAFKNKKEKPMEDTGGSDFADLRRHRSKSVSNRGRTETVVSITIVIVYLDNNGSTDALVLHSVITLRWCRRRRKAEKDEEEEINAEDNAGEGGNTEGSGGEGTGVRVLLWVNVVVNGSGNATAMTRECENFARSGCAGAGGGDWDCRVVVRFNVRGDNIFRTLDVESGGGTAGERVELRLRHFLHVHTS